MATSDSPYCHPSPPLTQAINVACVKTHMVVCLGLRASKYSKWRTFITVLLGKYDLLQHIIAVDQPTGNSA